MPAKQWIPKHTKHLKESKRNDVVRRKSEACRKKNKRASRTPKTKRAPNQHNEALKRVEDMKTKVAENTVSVIKEKAALKKEIREERERLTKEWEVLNNAKKQAQLEMETNVTMMHLPSEDTDSRSVKEILTRIEDVKKQVEAELVSMKEMEQKIEAEKRSMAKERQELNKQIKKQNHNSRRLMEMYEDLKLNLETKDSRIEQLNNEAKIKETRIKELQQKLPRIAQLTDANKMLKYQHELLMTELKKKREWFQLCSNSFKAKGSTHALNYLAKIEQEIKKGQAALFCPDAAEHKAPDVPATARWTDFESDDEPDIDEKAIDKVTTETVASGADQNSPADTSPSNGTKADDLRDVLRGIVEELLESRIADIKGVSTHEKGRDADIAETVKSRCDHADGDRDTDGQMRALADESENPAATVTSTSQPKYGDARKEESMEHPATNATMTKIQLQEKVLRDNERLHMNSRSATPPSHDTTASVHVPASHPQPTRDGARRKGKEEESPELPMIDDIAIQELAMARGTTPHRATVNRQGRPRGQGFANATSTRMVELRGQGRRAGGAAHHGRPANARRQPPTYRGIPEAKREAQRKEVKKIRQRMHPAWTVTNKHICWDFNTEKGCSEGNECIFSHRFFRDELILSAEEIRKGKKPKQHPYRSGIPFIDIAHRYNEDPNFMKKTIFHDNGKPKITK